MKVAIQDYGRVYDFYFTAETVEEAALLIRCGLNSRCQDKDFTILSHVGGKEVNMSMYVPQVKDRRYSVRRRP